MKTNFLKGLSFAGLCLMAMSTSTTAVAQGPCPTCPQQQCPPGVGYARTGCQHDSCLCPIIKWALCDDYYILPPDYGWTAPTKVPVVRQNVTYDRYYPSQWYGTAAPQSRPARSYPTAYQPTDTTQLGYTYQHVPVWQPAPYRLPPPPVPSQWHVREAHRGYRGHWHDQYTPIHHHQATSYQYSPIRSHMAVPTQMQAVPIGPVPCPPAPEQTAPMKIEPAPAIPMPVAPPVPAAEPKTAKRSGDRSFITSLLGR